jgi:hypothetical protein
MPKLPGDGPKKIPTNLVNGSKVIKKQGGIVGTSVGKKAYRIAKSGSSGRFVSKSVGKENPASTETNTMKIVTPGAQVLTVAAAGRMIQSLRDQLAHMAKPHPTEPITVRVYLDTDDAVKTVKVIKAVDDVLASAGYGKLKIENVEAGSVRLRIKAWLDGEDGQKAQQVGKQKLGEAAGYMEQWAKDATVNKQRAEISAINAQTAQALIESVKDIDNIALQMDEWLIVKYVDASGTSNASVRKLTVTELQLVERSPGLLNEPAKVLENLSMLAYQEEHGQVALES